MKVRFDDLLDIRIGNHEAFLSGAGESEIVRLKTDAEWNMKAEALRELFTQTLGIPSEDIDAPLAPDIVSEEDKGSHLLRKVLFNVEKGERIDGYLLVPKRLVGQAPAVLCLTPTTELGKEQTIGNGTSAKDADRAYALHLVERGYVAFTFDWDSSGTRRYPGLRPFDNAPFYDKHPNWSGVGKNLWDIGKVLDLMRSFTEVDRDRIGCIGHSQGGGGTLHAMAMDPRIKVGVSSCGGFPVRMDKNPYHEARDSWWIGRPALRPYFLTGKTVPCDLHELLALCAPRPFLYIAALNDCQHSIEESDDTKAELENMAENVEHIYALTGGTGNFKRVFHLAGHGFDKKRREIAYEFLDLHL